jgi:ABC-type uncharacterized transport system permease subunit
MRAGTAHFLKALQCPPQLCDDFAMNAQVPAIIAITLYLLAGSLLTLRLVRGNIETGCDRNQIILIGLAAIIIHTAMLYPSILTGSGLNLGFFYAASLIALTTSLLLVLHPCSSLWRTWASRYSRWPP